jgi:hypothetical protein
LIGAIAIVAIGQAIGAPLALAAGSSSSQRGQVGLVAHVEGHSQPIASVVSIEEIGSPKGVVVGRSADGLFKVKNEGSVPLLFLVEVDSTSGESSDTYQLASGKPSYLMPGEARTFNYSVPVDSSFVLASRSVRVKYPNGEGTIQRTLGKGRTWQMTPKALAMAITTLLASMIFLRLMTFELRFRRLRHRYESLRAALA